VAEPAGGGFEYREEDEEVFGPEGCLLRFEAAGGDEVVVEDVNHRCRSYWCGQRAAIGRTAFRR
jgi:hypothetical protein